MINKYPDGSSYAEVLKTFYGSTFRINSYEDLWHLHQSVDAFVHKFGYTPRITIPNLLDAQADRRFAVNQSAGLKLVCNFLCNMNAFFDIFHPHNAEVVEVLIPNSNIIKPIKFLKEVYEELIHKDLIILSPDAGAFKWVYPTMMEINPDLKVMSASKSRDKGKITTELPVKDFQGKDLLVIDDLSIYGGTFKALSKLLKERNVGNLYLAVSHMTVQNLGKAPVTNYFDKVFTTNSKFNNYFYQDLVTDNTFIPDNLEVIKIFDV